MVVGAPQGEGQRALEGVVLRVRVRVRGRVRVRVRARARVSLARLAALRRGWDQGPLG